MKDVWIFYPVTDPKSIYNAWDLCFVGIAIALLAAVCSLIVECVR